MYYSPRNMYKRFKAYKLRNEVKKNLYISAYRPQQYIGGKEKNTYAILPANKLYFLSTVCV